ncbi:MAG: hypothetical protein ABFS39_03530 [Pseudomonadota bacterium]
MDSQLEQLIEVNIKGRVFAVCQSRSVIDPAIIGYYTEILGQAVRASLHKNTTPAEFNHVLDEQAAWLESEIDQTAPAVKGDEESAGEHPAVEEDAAPADSKPKAEDSEKAPPLKRPTGYVPNAKSMPERLADQRVGMQHLLEKECVTLKLVTPTQAKHLKRRLLGQEPEKAEQELVAELRNILHLQVRKFIRKNDGGPWSSATLQHELRMDIIATRTLRSLVTLAKELLFEREAWLNKNKTSLAGRLFGGKISFKK